MRSLLLLTALAACEPNLPRKALPDLVRQAPLSAMSVPALGFTAGEQMTWTVTAKGFTIGRAELAVGEGEIHSRFETGRLVSAFARVRHELTTVVDQTGARAATESLEVDGEVSHHSVEFPGHAKFVAGSKVGTIPDGNLGHTLHSALGVIRAWAAPGARAGFLYIVHDGEVYRLDVGQPYVEDLRGRPTLKIAARIKGDVSASLTIWLSASAEHVPLRLEIGAEDVRLTAELLETEA
jgi:hypothetical protein